MKHNLRNIGLTLAAIGSFAAGGWLTAGVATKEKPSPPKIIVADKPIERAGRFGASFAPMVKKVSPSVVNVYSDRTMRFRAPANPFFDFFGGSEPRGGRPFTQRGTGSGVIMSEDGYIITNTHVVENADKDSIRVMLQNDKTVYLAKVVGTDPQTDIAVLKIDAKKLKPIVVGDSDQVEVGDLVLAVGNPFDVGQSVTMGMVSGLGRDSGGSILGREGYEDFIQTDAPINPGNSGGALVDVEGRLIGINQSIVSGSGASAGVGFAVPINLARSIMDRLVTDGKVTRGLLGIGIQTLTPDLAQEFNLKNDEGALVGSVEPDSAAAKAGVKEGDVVTEFSGKKVSDSRHLRLMVAQTAPDTKVTLKLIRDGKEKTINATVGHRDEETISRRMRRNSFEPEPKEESLDGAEVTDLDARTRRQNNIPANVQGVYVTRVEPGSPEDKGGLKAGDVIVEIDRQPIKNAEVAVTLSKKFEDKRMLLRVWSNDGGQAGMRYLTVDNSKK